MNKPQLSTGVGVALQRLRNNPIFSVLQKSRNLVGALLLSAASVSFAQDKPHPIAEDINFMHADDPTEEALDHMLPRDHHLHTIAEAHYSRNHVTQDGNLEKGSLAGLGIHSQIPLTHTDNSSTLAKVGFHGLSSTNDTDPLRREFTFDAGLVHRYNDWKFSVGANLLHEESQLTESHTETEIHDDGHGHKKSVTHTTTATHPHKYTGVGLYVDIAHELPVCKEFQGKIFGVLHLEHDKSRTGNGNYVSAGIQAYKLPITQRLHADAYGLVVYGDGERFKEHNLSSMIGGSLHYKLGKDWSVYGSYTRIMNPSNFSGNGDAVTFGFSWTK